MDGLNNQQNMDQRDCRDPNEAPYAGIISFLCVLCAVHSAIQSNVQTTPYRRPTEASTETTISSFEFLRERSLQYSLLRFFKKDIFFCTLESN